MSSQLSLSLVSNLDDIRGSLATFNSSGSAAPVPGLVRQTEYWVYDPDTRMFGPGKYVGFRDMTHTAYRRAKRVGSAADRFDGYATRTRIERVVGGVFHADNTLAKQLASWAQRLLGDAPFDGVDTSKWKFLSLQPRPPATHQVHENGNSLDARFSVEQVGDQFTLVVESRGGTRGKPGARNADYVPALVLLLARLKSVGARVEDALVDSRATARMPENRRRLRHARL